MTEPPKVLQLLDANPYTADTQLVALTVRELLPQEEREINGLLSQGHSIWRAAQRALIWWTPARVEQEALKRAADDPVPSVIAREVAVFTALYEQFVTCAAAVERVNASARMHLGPQVSGIRYTLEALERRAQSAESRATDYRLRYEFDLLRQVVAGREYASQIATVIENASKNTESAEYATKVLTEFMPAFERVQRDLSAVRLDVNYTADLVMQESVRRMLPRERVKESASLLGDLVGTGTFLSQVLGSIAGSSDELAVRLRVPRS